MRRRDFLLGLLSLPLALKAAPRLVHAEPAAAAASTVEIPTGTTIRLADGTLIGLGDWVEDRLYGTEEYGAGQMIQAFSSGRSQKLQ